MPLLVHKPYLPSENPHSKDERAGGCRSGSKGEKLVLLFQSLFPQLPLPPLVLPVPRQVVRFVLLQVVNLIPQIIWGLGKNPSLIDRDSRSRHAHASRDVGRMQTFTCHSRKQPPRARGAENPLLVVISEQSGTHGGFLRLGISPTAPGFPGGGKTEQESRMRSAADRVSVAGRHRSSAHGGAVDAGSASPASIWPQGILCLARRQIPSQAAQQLMLPTPYRVLILL